MYFLHGWPKSFRAPLRPEKIVSIKYSPNMQYIAVVTISTLYIWSGDQHRIVLGYYHRSPGQINRDGENECVYWRPSGHIALTTRNGRIYFVDLFEDKGGVDLLYNPIEESENPQQRITFKPTVKLNLRGTFPISHTGIAWMYEYKTKLFTCSHDGVLQHWTPTRDQYHLNEEIPIYSFSHTSLSLLFKHESSETLKVTENHSSAASLTSSNKETEKSDQSATSQKSPSIETKSKPIISKIPSIEEFGKENEDMAVMSMEYCPTIGMMVAAFQGGRAAVMIGKIEDSISNLQLYWLPVKNATIVCLNSTKHLITVGLNTGDVHLYDASKELQLIKVLSLSHWEITKKDTGAVTCLQWTPDGRVLAVGYAARGLSTWTSHGCRLNCTISQTNILNETVSSIFSKQNQRSGPSATNNASNQNETNNPTSNDTSSVATNSKDNTNSTSISGLSNQDIMQETAIEGNLGQATSNPSTTSQPPSPRSSVQQESQEYPRRKLNANGKEIPYSKPSVREESNRKSSERIPGFNKPNSQPGLKEAARYGVSSLCWGTEGYHLLTSSCHSSKIGIIDQFQFFKASIASNLNLNYCQRILLQGDDRLLMLVNRGKEVGVELSWKHIQVPTVFLQDNWPLKLVSVSSDGSYIVISGKKGFVVYNCSTNSWQLFGDRAEEQSIQCVGISWYKQFIVATIFSETMKTHQVLFFPRNQKLSLSSAVYRASVPQNKIPKFLDCNDSDLILFTEDSYFQYKIIVEGESGTNNSPSQPSVSLKLIHQVSLDHPFNPASILLLPSNVVTPENQSQVQENREQTTSKSFSRSPSFGEPQMSMGTSANTPTQQKSNTRKSSKTMSKLIVLDSHGNLILTNAERSIHLELSRSIEQFWMANTNYVNDLGNTLWAYGERGLEVWFPFFHKTPTQNYLSRDRSLEFDFEICPIGFLHQWGIIVGAGQGTTNGPASDSPCFELQTKTQPFLHFVLKRMLEKGEHHQAVHLAKQYSYLPHFTHSLELLLHEALEAQHELDRKKRRTKNQNDKTSKASDYTNDESNHETYKNHDDTTITDTTKRASYPEIPDMDQNSVPKMDSSNIQTPRSDSSRPSISRSNTDLEIEYLLNSGRNSFDSVRSDTNPDSPMQSNRSNSSEMLYTTNPRKSPISSSRNSFEASNVLKMTSSSSGSVSSSNASISKKVSKEYRRVGKDRPSHSLLRKVVDFLKEFGLAIYTSVIVACARKTDPVLWTTLFNPKYNTGKPTALFEHCIEAGKIIVAASYLRIIQFTDSEEISRKAGLKCLDLCLKMEDLELLRDLMRFLEPTMTSTIESNDQQLDDQSNNNNSSSTTPRESNMSSSISAESTTNQSSNSSNQPSNSSNQSKTISLLENDVKQEIQLQDMLLSKYARKLLESHQMRMLVRFSKITKRDLRIWLQRERKRAAIIEDFPAALADLHAQFNIPRPTHFPVGHLLQDASNSIKDYSMIYFPNSDYLESELDEETEDPMNGKYSTSDDDIYGSLHESNMISSFKDLEYLLQEMAAADCVGWTLVIGSVLFRLSTLIRVLKNHPIFWRVYKPMLEAEESKGYKDLLQYLESQLGL